EGPGIPPGAVITAAEVAAMFTPPASLLPPPGSTPEHDPAPSTGHAGRTPDAGNASGAGGAAGAGQGCGPSSWGPQISVRPVLDLNEEHQVQGYTAGEVIKEHLQLRDRTCVFPHCTYTARACDCDHIEPWQTDEHGRPTGGPTCTCNLAPLRLSHESGVSGR